MADRWRSIPLALLDELAEALAHWTDEPAPRRHRQLDAVVLSMVSGGGVTWCARASVYQLDLEVQVLLGGRDHPEHQALAPWYRVEVEALPVQHRACWERARMEHQRRHQALGVA